METLETIKNRRSIRAYTKQELSKRLVEDIITCGRLAPSAKNRQPWYFVIVKDNIKDKIANMMIDVTKNHKDKYEREQLGCNSSVKSTAKVILEAPILILIFKEKNDNWKIGDNLSIGACIQNMCLRATDLGIGTLWIRDIVYVAYDVALLLNHSDMELNCALTLGYSNENPKPRSRKKLKDIIEWYSTLN